MREPSEDAAEAAADAGTDAVTEGDTATEATARGQAEGQSESLNEYNAESSGARRPGRFRRWILRPVLWLVVLVAALAAILLWLVHLPRFQRSLLERYLPVAESALGRVITVGEARARLLPLTIELRNVTLAGPRLGDPPVVTLRRFYADIDLPSLWQRNLQLDRVEVDGLTVFVEQLGTESNLPSFRRSPREDPTTNQFRVALGTLEISDSALRYEQLDIPLVASGQGIEATLLGQSGLAAEGQLAIADGELQIGDGKLVTSFDGRIRVDTSGLEIDAGRMQTADSALSVRGSIGWSGEPQVDLQISGVASTRLAQDLGYIESEVRAQANIDGSFTWRPEAWGFRSEVESDEVLVMEQWSIANVGARVAGDPNGVIVDLLHARYANGLAEGRYEIGFEGQAATSSIDLRLKDASTQRLLNSFGAGVDGLGGLISGDLSYRFLDGDWQAGTGWGTLRLDKTSLSNSASAGARKPALPPSLALAGSIPFTIEAGILSAQAVRLTAPQQRVLLTAVYDLGRASGEIRGGIDSLDVAPIVRLLPGGGDVPPPLWLPQSGRGHVDIVARLRPSTVLLDVDLELQEVAAPGLVADRATGHLELRGEALENLRFEFTRAGGAAMLTGRVPFGSLEGLDLGLLFVGWPLVDAQPWLPFDLPLEGLYHGNVELEGQGEALVGLVKGRIDEALVEGIPLGSLSTDLSWDADRLQVNEAAIVVGEGGLRAAGTLEFENGGLDLQLDATRVALDRLPAAASVADLYGLVEGRVEIGGTLDNPRLDVTADLSELSLGEVVPGQGTAAVELHWVDGEVELQGVAAAWLTVEGGGRLDSSGSALEVNVVLSDLSQVASLVAPESDPVAGSLEATIRLSGEGPLAIDRATVVIPTADLAIGDNRLNLLEEARVSWTPSELLVESLYLGEPGTDADAFVRGRIGLDDPQPLDFQIQARVGADWLEIFLPDSELSGEIDILGSLRGTLDSPKFRAQAGIEGGRYRQAGLDQTLDAIDGIVLFDPDAIVIDRVVARLGAGSVVAAGRLDWPAEGEPLTGRVQLAIDDATIHYPEGMEMRGRGELVWAGAQSGQSIRGLVTLDRARYLQDLDIDLLSLIEGFLRRRPETVVTANQELDQIAVNVAVRAPGTLRIKNNVADLRGTADLSLRGTLARPVVFGTVESAEGSVLEYGGNDYELSRAVVTFANPYRMEPLFDVEATTKIAAYDVAISLFGSLDRLQVSFGSDPPLPDAEVLSLLLVGRPAATSGLSGPDGPTAESLLYGQASSLIGKRVGTLFGFDSLRVEPLSTSGKSLSSARVSVGKRLSSRWYATYSYDPSSTANQRIQLEWQVTDSLLIRLTQDDDSYGVDFLWENSF